jgi:hypothetical protein
LAMSPGLKQAHGSQLRRETTGGVGIARFPSLRGATVPQSEATASDPSRDGREVIMKRKSL